MAEPQRGEKDTWRFLALWDESGQIALEATRAQLPADDLHAAVLADEVLWPGQLHHASDLERWHVWSGTHHRPDDSAMISRVVDAFAGWYEQLIGFCQQQVAARAVAQLAQGSSQAAIDRAVKAAWEPWEGCAKYAAGLRRSAGSGALKARMAGRCGVPEAWLDEQLKDYVNTLSGMEHLPTGHVYPHDPAARVTYCVNARVDWDAQCPEYEKLILRACGGNQAVAWYLIKALGYALTGSNPRQLIFYLKGPTASGKSALLNVARIVLGPLASPSVTELVTVKRERNARVEYSLRNKRLITITETSGFLNLDEAQLKRLTGESHIAVGRHYAKEQLTIPVTWTIFIATNEMPVMANPDAAMSRRTVVIPMGSPVPELEQILDLDEKIAAAERDGILALLLRGAMAAASEGLDAPAEVTMATAEYLQNQDTLTSFLADCTLTEAQASANGRAGERLTANQHLTWEAYRWHTRNGPRLPKQEFKSQLLRVPGIWANENRRTYEGFEIQPWVTSQVERF